MFEAEFLLQNLQVREVPFFCGILSSFLVLWRRVTSDKVRFLSRRLTPLVTAANKPITLKNANNTIQNRKPNKVRKRPNSPETLPFVDWLTVNFNPKFCTLFDRLVFFYVARLQWSHCKPPFNGYLCSVHRNLAQSNKALITCALSLRASSFFRLVSSSSRFLSSSSRFLLSCEMKINKINFDCLIYTSAISISIFTLR